MVHLVAMSVSCLCDNLAIYKLRLTLSSRVYCLSDLRGPVPFFICAFFR